MFDPFTLLWAFIFAIIAHIVSSKAIRWAVETLHLDIPYQQLLEWLADRRVQPKAALTKKEIHGIIKRVDEKIVPDKVKNRIVSNMYDQGLITELKNKELTKHHKNALVSDSQEAKLSIKWENLFLMLRPVIEHNIVDPLNTIYDNERVACIVVLPFPRDSKSRLSATFERALKKCLASQGVPVDFLTPAVLKGRPHAQSLKDTKDTEKLLVLQPVGLNDEYLQKSVDYIHKYSRSPIAEILTIIKLSDQASGQTDPNVQQRMLIEFDLKCYEGEIDNANN